MTEVLPESEREGVQRIAASLEAQGYTVTQEPDPVSLPFYLGGYRPDMVARRGDESLVIEVKRSVGHQPIDRLKQIAAEVASQPGWRFVLITQEDAADALSGKEPSWEDLKERQASAQHLIESEQVEAGYLLLWTAFEAAMRWRAREIHLGVERLPHSQLIRHLYSHGELSMEAFDQALRLAESRNRLAHGYVVEDVANAAEVLSELLDGVLREWSESPTKCAAPESRA